MAQRNSERKAKAMKGWPPTSKLQPLVVIRSDGASESTRSTVGRLMTNSTTPVPFIHLFWLKVLLALWRHSIVLVGFPVRSVSSLSSLSLSLSLSLSFLLPFLRSFPVSFCQYVPIAFCMACCVPFSFSFRFAFTATCGPFRCSQSYNCF